MKEPQPMRKKYKVGSDFVDPRYSVVWYKEWMENVGNHIQKCVLCGYVGKVEHPKYPHMSHESCQLVKNHIVENHFIIIETPKTRVKGAWEQRSERRELLKIIRLAPETEEGQETKRKAKEELTRLLKVEKELKTQAREKEKAIQTQLVAEKELKMQAKETKRIIQRVELRKAINAVEIKLKAAEETVRRDELRKAMNAVELKLKAEKELKMQAREKEKAVQAQLVAGRLMQQNELRKAMNAVELKLKAEKELKMQAREKEKAVQAQLVAGRLMQQNELRKAMNAAEIKLKAEKELKAKIKAEKERARLQPCDGELVMITPGVPARACTYLAKVVRDGKHYCLHHDPELINERHKAPKKRVKKENSGKNESKNRQKERNITNQILTEEDREVQKIIKARQMPNRHPLKPWQDPESLFCDTAFLKELIKKTPKKGIECKDTPAVEGKKK